eukprot:9598943-Karenia_brevis.AAC.1
MAQPAKGFKRTHELSTSMDFPARLGMFIFIQGQTIPEGIQLPRILRRQSYDAQSDASIFNAPIPGLDRQTTCPDTSL